MRALRVPALLVLIAILLLAPAAARAQAPACPCTLYGASDAPLGDAAQDAALEVGVKLRSDEDGYISAVRFYKQPNNTGTHVGHVWSASGQLLARRSSRTRRRPVGSRRTWPSPVPITPQHDLRRLVPLEPRLLRP